MIVQNTQLAAIVVRYSGDVYGRWRGSSGRAHRHHDLASEVAHLFPALVEATVSTVTTPRSGRLSDSRFSSTFVSA